MYYYRSINYSRRQRTRILCSRLLCPSLKVFPLLSIGSPFSSYCISHSRRYVSRLPTYSQNDRWKGMEKGCQERGEKDRQIRRKRQRSGHGEWDSRLTFSVSDLRDERCTSSSSSCIVYKLWKYWGIIYTYLCYSWLFCLNIFCKFVKKTFLSYFINAAITYWLLFDRIYT